MLVKYYSRWCWLMPTALKRVGTYRKSYDEEPQQEPLKERADQLEVIKERTTMAESERWPELLE